MKAASITLAAALLLSGARASAQSANDAGCLLLSNVFAQKAAEPEVKKIAEIPPSISILGGFPTAQRRRS